MSDDGADGRGSAGAPNRTAGSRRAPSSEESPAHTRLTATVEPRLQNDPPRAVTRCVLMLLKQCESGYYYRSFLPFTALKGHFTPRRPSALTELISGSLRISQKVGNDFLHNASSCFLVCFEMTAFITKSWCNYRVIKIMQRDRQMCAF